MNGRNACWIVGAGGHAKVAVDVMRSQGCEVLGLFDDDPSLLGRIVNGVFVLASVPSTRLEGRALGAIHIAIGSNAVRGQLSHKLGGPWQSAIHRTAWKSESSSLGHGSMLGAQSVVQCDARVGSHVIVNSGAIVEHDVEVGSFAHIAPRALLGGAAKIGEGAFIGAGAVVLPNIEVGNWCIVGAGAVVTANVDDGVVVVGVPARPIDRTRRGQK